MSSLEATRKRLRRMRAALRRLRQPLAMSALRTDSAEPLSTDFGYSRGTPIDRYYIENFLEQHSADIHGHVLEIGDDTYSRRFGGNRIARQDILHVTQQPQATIVGDLAEPSVLPASTFDCMIVTQTLHLIFDPRPAIAAIKRALKPGGVALITVPGISPIDRGEWKDSWYWSMTELSLSRLLCPDFDADKITITTFGNLFSATAFLRGAAIEDVPRVELDPLDPAYPVTVTARAVA